MDIQVKYWKNNTQENQILKAVSIVNGLQNYYHFILKALTEDVVNTPQINWDSFCNEFSNNGNEYAIFITEKDFDDNWFLHVKNQFSIITTSDWEDCFAPPSLKAYLVYLIAQSAIGFEGNLSEKMEARIVHNHAEGCMFDFCMNKSDIRLGMTAGNICPKCRAILVRYGICEKAIDSTERMLNYVRAEAIGKPMIFDENAAFIIMHFSQNDENENAYLYGIKPALEEIKIKCVRADNQVLPGQLLENIEENIKNSRFVIIKVDSNNLNVYFELGLAFGLNKDVLLISEKDLILNLPSDLRNWECLTYSKGNYEELSDNIKKFFADNYHYTL